MSLNWDRHESVIQSDIEQFLSVLAPAYLSATINRDWSPLATGTGKWLNINFKRARLVRLVRDPLSIGRELCILFIEVRLNDREWLSLSIQWQCPDVPAF